MAVLTQVPFCDTAAVLLYSIGITHLYYIHIIGAVAAASFRRIASARHGAPLGLSIHEGGCSIVGGVTLYPVLDTKVVERTSDGHIAAHLNRHIGVLAPQIIQSTLVDVVPEAAKVPRYTRAGSWGQRSCRWHNMAVEAGQQGSFATPIMLAGKNTQNSGYQMRGVSLTGPCDHRESHTSCPADVALCCNYAGTL
jgi:hypothetical protein